VLSRKTGAPIWAMLRILFIIHPHGVGKFANIR